MKNYNLPAEDFGQTSLDTEDLEAFLMLVAEPYLSDNNEILYRFKAS